MGFFIFSNNGKINYGIKNYVADTEKDLEQIPTRYPGSIVYVIKTQKFYMVNQNGTWVETKGGNGSSEIDETQVNALIDAKIAQVPTLPDPTGSDNQVLMTQDGAWTVSTIPEGQTVIIDETLSTADNDHVPSTKLVTNTINTINTSIAAINNAGYQTAADVQGLINAELSDITSFEYYLCELGEYDLTTKEPDADTIHAASIERGDNPLQPDSQHIYLTPGSNDNLNMYAYINEAFVFLGTTAMELENYYDKDYINAALELKADTNDLENFITLNDVSDAGYLTSVDWGDISNPPSTYTPSTHTHNYSDITNHPTIPTQTSQLENNSGFLTANDLTGAMHYRGMTSTTITDGGAEIATIGGQSLTPALGDVVVDNSGLEFVWDSSNHWRQLGDENSYALRNELITGIVNNIEQTKRAFTLSKPLTAAGGDADGSGKIILDETQSGQITNKGTKTLLGFTSDYSANANNIELKVGTDSYALRLRGNETNPRYNGNDLALSSDIPSPIASNAVSSLATDSQFASAKAEYDTRNMITVKSKDDGIIYKIQVKDSNFNINTLQNDPSIITIIK